MHSLGKTKPVQPTSQLIYEDHKSKKFAFKARKSLQYSNRASLVGGPLSAGRRYTFSYEREEDVKKKDADPLMSYGQMEMISSSDLEYAAPLEYGTAFKFSGGDVSTNRKVYEDSYASIFTYDVPFVSEIYGVNPLEEVTESKRNPYDTSTRIKDAKIFSSFFFGILCSLSFLTLLCFLPFIGWIFIKRLKSNQRMVVFRLGHRMNTKGPGLIVLLPFVDKFHLVDLNQQTVELKNLAAGTIDGAVMELDWCKVHFRVVDPDLVVIKASKKPKHLVRMKVETGMPNAINKVESANLAHGGMGRYEVTADLRNVLNGHCLPFGVQIADINLGEFTMIKGPPPKKNIFDQLNLGSIGSAMTGGGLASALFSSGTEGDTKDVIGENAFNADGTRAVIPPETKTALNSFIYQLASMSANHNRGTGNPGEPSSSASTTSTVATGTSSTFSNGHGGSHNVNASVASAIARVAEEEQHMSRNPADISPVDLSQFSNEGQGLIVLLSAVVARANPLLKSEAACRALGRTSLQLTLVEDGKPVPLDYPGSDGVACAFMDASKGVAGIGKLLDGKPTVDLQMTRADLQDALAGRLDMVDAIASNRARMRGDLFALTKLRFLIQMQPSKST